MDRAQYAVNYFIKQGWTPVQAAAIVGNLQQESGMGLNPTAANPNDPGTSIGIGQWNRDRKAALFNFAKAAGASPTDFETQLAFVQHELAGPESAAAKALRGAGDIGAATAAFIGYERPQGWSASNPAAGHGWANRLNNATALLGGAPASSGDDPSIVAQNYGFQFPHAPDYSPMPGTFNVGTAANTTIVPPAAKGLLETIFGKMGEQKKPYYNPKASNAYLAQHLEEKGWPSLLSYLG